jgi:hypothetical protein
VSYGHLNETARRLVLGCRHPGLFGSAERSLPTAIGDARRAIPSQHIGRRPTVSRYRLQPSPHSAVFPHNQGAHSGDVIFLGEALSTSDCRGGWPCFPSDQRVAIALVNQKIPWNNPPENASQGKVTRMVSGVTWLAARPPHERIQSASGGPATRRGIFSAKQQPPAVANPKNSAMQGQGGVLMTTEKDPSM